jgi:hypothetical protein
MISQSLSKNEIHCNTFHNHIVFEFYFLNNFYITFLFKSFAAAANFKDEWTFYSQGCKVSTKSDPDKTFPIHQTAHFGASPKCTNLFTEILENACLHQVEL